MRQTSAPAFWNMRYAQPGWTFGDGPSAFVQAQAHRFAPGSVIWDVGAGEGRNALFLAAQGHRVTALDFAQEGLDKARQAALAQGVPLQTEVVDLVTWEPEQTCDGLVCILVHLLPEERLRLFAKLQRALRPGGVLVAEWFRPEQLSEGHPSGGPSTPDRLVTLAEVQAHFTAGRLLVAESPVVVLAEGRYLQGTAALVRIVFQKAVVAEKEALGSSAYDAA